jgi:putative phage-type endonuclease
MSAPSILNYGQTYLPFRIELDTADMTPEEFSAKRRDIVGIGASQSAAACGSDLDPWCSPFRLWCELTGNAPAREYTEAMEAGHRMEPVIAKWFADKKRDDGLTVEPWDNVLRSVEWPWMFCTPDRLVVTRDGDEQGLELKAPGFFAGDEWEDDDVPMRVQIQCQHSMAVTGLDMWWVAAFIGGKKLRIVDVPRDERHIESIVRRTKAFWQLVEDRTPPATDGSKSTADALSYLYDPVPGSELELDDTDGEAFVRLCDRRAYMKAALKPIESEIDALDNEIKALMGSAEVAIVDGRKRATWKTVNRKGYEVAPTSYRQLRVNDMRPAESEPF